MKPSIRIYIDAFLQNIKNVAFFMFLPVLIAKLGANSLEISLSNALPPLFCAFSLAFITRQLPLTSTVYYRAGMLRQFAFLCMAFSPLLPHPIFWLLFFWTFNAIFVMVTSVQQQAIIRHTIPEYAFASLFSRTKMIAIVVTVIGSYTIGAFLDSHQSIFPYNYIWSMVAGAVSTFVGMSLISQLAPKEKKAILFQIVRPLRHYSRVLISITIASASISVMAPLWTIYHVNVRHLSNTQIGLFSIASGIVSTLLLPFFRKILQRFGTKIVIVSACFIMAVVPLFYGFVSSFPILLALQTVIGVSFSCYDVAQQTLAQTEAKNYPDEIAYFSDYQLVQNLGNGVAPFLTVIILSLVTVTTSFVVLSILKIGFVLIIAALLKPQTALKPATLSFQSD